MSTKIFNGFRFRDSNLLDLHKLFLDWRAQLAPLVVARALDEIAKICVDTLDSHRFAAAFPSPRVPKGAPNGVLTKAVMGIMARQRAVENTNRRDPNIDLEFNVSVLPNPVDGRIYGIIYTEQGDFRKAFLNRPDIEPFPYWNNTDQPDGMSEEEWDARGALWDQVLDQHPSSVPSMIGFTVQCTDPNLSMWPRPEDVVAHFPPKERRIEAWVNNLVFDEMIAAALEEGTMGPHRIMEIHRAATGSAGAERRAAVCAAVNDALPDVYTRADLMAALPGPSDSDD